jgi:RNA polymerase sigma factor (sigma-70 family)
MKMQRHDSGKESIASRRERDEAVNEDRVKEIFEILEKVAVEKQRELERIAERYRNLGVDKDECYQETFVRVWRWLPWKRLLTKQDGAIYKIILWVLSKTMKRIVIDELRRIKRQKNVPLEDLDPDGDGDSFIENPAVIERAKEDFDKNRKLEVEADKLGEWRWKSDKAMEWLKGKDPQRHQIVSLKLAEMTDSEIARLVGISESTVKKEWGLAVKQLRNHLRNG